MKDDKLYVIYINECIEKIQNYTSAGKDVFFDDTKTQDAVLRNLHTLSESIQRLSPNLKTKYPQTDWRSIEAFRNVIVHDYLGIDINEIWDIVERDLPELKRVILILIKDLKA